MFLRTDSWCTAKSFGEIGVASCIPECPAIPLQSLSFIPPSVDGGVAALRQVKLQPVSKLSDCLLNWEPRLARATAKSGDANKTTCVEPGLPSKAKPS